MNKCHSLPLFKWSMHQAACLSNRQLPEKWIHLHGTRDLLLPGMFICGAIKVKGGDHAMVMGKAEEIGRHVTTWLEGNKKG